MIDWNFVITFIVAFGIYEFGKLVVTSFIIPLFFSDY